MSENVETPQRLVGTALAMKASQGAWDDLTNDDDILPNGYRRCTAHSKQASAAAGEPVRCKSAALEGMRVCSMHGGKSPNARRARMLRLMELVDPAIAKLAKVVETGEDRDALRAIENILDRAGYPRRSEIDVEASREVLRERILLLQERVVGAGDSEGSATQALTSALAGLPSPEDDLDDDLE